MSSSLADPHTLVRVDWAEHVESRTEALAQQTALSALDAHGVSPAFVTVTRLLSLPHMHARAHTPLPPSRARAARTNTHTDTAWLGCSLWLLTAGRVVASLS